MNRRHSCIALGVILLALLAVGLPGVPAVAETGMRRVEEPAWPGFEDDLSGAGLADAVAASLSYYGKLPAGRRFQYGADLFTARELAAGLDRFERFLQNGPEASEIAAFVRKHAAVYTHMDAGQPANVLFTGYFEPELAGSRTRTQKFRYPVYARPKDLVTVDLSQFSGFSGKKELVGRLAGNRVVPYYDRQTIDTTDVLAATAEPLAWVADPVALFFLHVQGSGKIRLENGEALNVQYDITNGLPYRSIGKYLIDHGRIPTSEMSMQAIRDYIAAHPEERDQIFHCNPRFVFFRTRPHGTVGCLNVPLTAGRSIALDQQISPAGSLLWIAAEKPVCDANGKIEKWSGFSRFAFNQDTGTAIRGPARADIFWGSGAYAETAAGYMKHRGRLYFIVIKP